MELTLSSENALSMRARRMLEIALALGGFSLGTGEFATMGLMPEIANSFHVSETQVGHIISSYALGVVVGAPLIAILGARFSRRQLILFMMILFAVGNIASALASSYFSLIIIRFITGLPHGAYFGVAGLVAASIVPVHERARAVSRFMLGVTLSIVVGAPLATWCGQLMNWQSSFGFVGALAFTTLVMVFLFLPAGLNEKRSNPLAELGALKNRQVWFTLGVAAIGFAGMFCVFSYLTPALTSVTGIGQGWVPLMLSLFGIGSVLGNVIGGRLTDRLQFDAVGYILAGSALVLFLYPFAMKSIWFAAPGVLLVGCMMAIAPALSIRLMDVARDAQTLAAALNHGAFNMANALGPWLGGLAITAGFGWTVTGYVGCVMALMGLTIFGVAKKYSD